MIRKDFYAPTPKYWRQIGDFALILLVTIQPMIDTMPIGDITKYWLGFGSTIILVGIKFWTNTKSVHSK